MVNYFPVYLNIGQLLQQFPPSGNFTYKLSQDDSAVNFVYTNLTLATAFNYLRSSATLTANTGFGDDGIDVCDQAAVNANKHNIGNITSRLTSCLTIFWPISPPTPATSWGVILVDGCNTTNKPLVLTVSKTGTIVAQVQLPLSISGVENMYRQLNLRDDAAYAPPSTLLVDSPNDHGDSTSIGRPPNFPDSANPNGWFIFVVGSNVGGQAGRGLGSGNLQAALLSHSHAKFVGVSWFGDPYDNGSYVLYNYQAAVRNAFATAPYLAQDVDNLFQGNVTIAGHSAGCLLIASAITDPVRPMNVNNAVFIDAAVAREAFDGNLDEDLYNMAHPSWTQVVSGKHRSVL